MAADLTTWRKKAENVIKTIRLLIKAMVVFLGGFVIIIDVDQKKCSDFSAGEIARKFF